MTTVEFRLLDEKKADELFTQPRDEQKWAEVVRNLMLGKSVFCPGMTRVARESLRSVINYRGYGVLHSRTMTESGQEGVLLRLDRKSQPGRKPKV